MKKRIIALLSLALLLLPVLSGCGSKPAQGSGTKVVLNEVAHSIFYAPMYVAIEEGYFAEEGLELDLITGFGVM